MKRLAVTVSCYVPTGMRPAHFRRLVAGPMWDGIYLSIADQLEADTSAGTIRPRVSTAHRAPTGRASR